MHYAVVKNDIRNFKKYDSLCKRFGDVLQAEAKIEEIYCHVVFNQNRSRAIRALEVATISEHLRILQKYDHVESSRVKMLLTTIRLVHYFSTFRYEEIIKECNEVIAFFKGRKGVYGSYLFGLLHKKALALIPLQQFEESKQMLKEAILYAPPGTYNWSLALIHRLVICFHQGSYQEAYDIYKAYSNKRVDISPALTEQWHILEAYIKFTVNMGLIEPYGPERFHLGKFLNEVPIFSQDKAGNNIAIHIIRTLFHLERKRYWPIIDDADALRQYNNRYLRKSETRRAYYFIKMLRQLPASDFHKTAVIRKTAADFERLKSIPIHSSQNFEIEIIPFEVLWELTLGMLDRKFHKIRKKQEAQSK